MCFSSQLFWLSLVPWRTEKSPIGFQAYLYYFRHWEDFRAIGRLPFSPTGLLAYGVGCGIVGISGEKND